MGVISPELLSILVCPESRTSLSLGDDRLMTQLNQRIGQRQLKNRAGDTLDKQLDGGLVREDRQMVYPIIDGIPILLVDEGIPLDQLEATNNH
jgi:uncharacterized protein YbaR (Trm112 family)